MNSRDKIAQHLTQQKARAVIQEDGSEYCQYKTASGAMCAVGCLIPDDKYKSTIEGYGVDILIENNAQMLPTDIDHSELCIWQSYHDDYCVVAQTSFSYKLWIAGDESHSPTAVKNKLDLVHGW